MLLALSVVCLFGAVFLATEVVSVGARQRALALRRASTYARPRIRTGPERLKFRERVIFPAATRLSRLAMRVNPRVTVESIQLKLMTAGLSQKISPTTFLALKAALAIGLGVFGLLLGSAVSFVGTLFFALGFGFAGFAFPGIYVWRDPHGAFYVVDHTGTRQLPSNDDQTGPGHLMIAEFWHSPPMAVDWAA